MGVAHIPRAPGWGAEREVSLVTQRTPPGLPGGSSDNLLGLEDGHRGWRTDMSVTSSYEHTQAN